MVTQVILKILEGLVVFSAVMAITRRNPVYSAVYLAMNFLCIGGIFSIYASPFLGAVQIIVYAGAILVLFVLAIMMINLDNGDIAMPRRTLVKFLSILFAVGFFWFISSVIVNMLPGKNPGHVFTAAEIGQYLLNKQAVAFEAVSVLLIVSFIAAIILAKKEVDF